MFSLKFVFIYKILQIPDFFLYLRILLRDHWQLNLPTLLVKQRLLFTRLKIFFQLVFQLVPVIRIHFQNGWWHSNILKLLLDGLFIPLYH